MMVSVPFITTNTKKVNTQQSNLNRTKAHSPTNGCTSRTCYESEIKNTGDEHQHC